MLLSENISSLPFGMRLSLTALDISAEPSEVDLTSASGIHQLPTAWNSSCRYIFEEINCERSFDLEYIICGAKVRVYALERDNFSELLMDSSSASAIQREAFENGPGKAAKKMKVSVSYKVCFRGIHHSQSSIPISRPPAN